MSAEATSRLAMRVGSSALLLAVCLASTGCTFFKQFGKDRPAEAGGLPPPKFPTGGAAPGGAAGTPTPAFPTTGASGNNFGNQGAMLAGRVVDGMSRPPANTSIRLVNIEDSKETDVAVNHPDGYFTIQGLKSGGRYKLVARGKSGDRLIAGVTLATAPNLAVFIQMREDLVNGSTPPLQAHPAAPANDGNKASSADPKSNGQGWSPSMAATQVPGGSEPNLPVAINVTRPSQPAPAQNWVPADQKPQTWPPTLEIPRTRNTLPPLQIPNTPPPQVPTPPPALDSKAAPPYSPKVTELLGRALVPSCVRNGNQFVNFALNDVNGKPWELRHRTGKLVLVDFWRTDCVPCLQALPYLRDLQTKYAPHLEVVGIASETDGAGQEQAYRVLGTAHRYGLNYRQLLSAGPDCPVRREFRIKFMPTLFLLDEQGFVLRSYEGSPALDERAELERLIQRRLQQAS